MYEMDKQPCWYANLEKTPRKIKWTVGVKKNLPMSPNSKEEFSFKMDQSDDVTSLSFAVKLIDVFRSGGKASVKEWLNL